MRFVAARDVRLLVNADQAFPEMLSAIDAARSSVDLETYILNDDDAGHSFQAALVRAAGRGVRVRLIYDWVGSLGLSRDFLRGLVEGGVAVSAYHPLAINRPVWALNHRDHRKILIVDEDVSFTGGLNIAEEHTLAPSGGVSWRDSHIRLDGPEVAASLTALFEYAWRRATPFDKTATRRAMLRWAVQRRLDRLLRRSPRAARPSPHDGQALVSTVGNEEFRYRWRIHRAYLRAIRQARRYVLIENAYFIPGRAVRKALVSAVRRGVIVAVVVAAHSDVPISGYAMRWLYNELLSSGVRVFEWPVGMMHAKTAVIDDVWSIVGSYNFDHRSLLHQLEVVAVVADPDFAARLRDQTLTDIAVCNEVDLDSHRRRPWRQRLLEYAAYALRHWL